MLYYSRIGSFDGAVKIGGRWIRAIELNRIDKTGWKRWQGPPSPALARAMREQPPIQAAALFPDLVVIPVPRKS